MDGGSHRGALLRSLLDPVMGSIADYQFPSAAPFVLSQHSDKGLLPQSCSQRRLSLVWRSRSISFLSISGLHQKAVHWPGWIFLRTGLWTNTLPTQSFLWEWLVRLVSWSEGSPCLLPVPWLPPAFILELGKACSLVSQTSCSNSDLWRPTSMLPSYSHH